VYTFILFSDSRWERRRHLFFWFWFWREWESRARMFACWSDIWKTKGKRRKRQCVYVTWRRFFFLFFFFFFFFFFAFPLAFFCCFFFGASNRIYRSRPSPRQQQRDATPHSATNRSFFSHSHIDHLRERKIEVKRLREMAAIRVWRLFFIQRLRDLSRW